MAKSKKPVPKRKPVTKQKTVTHEKPTAKKISLGWDTRFWAWLIDMLIIWFLAGIINPWNLWWPGSGMFNITSTAIVAFFYWTLLEGYSGQSIGKIALKIKMVPDKGKMGYGKSAVSSFGKAFLLPLDFIVGIFAFEGEHLRLFNRVAKTRVVWE